jgi:hypothetical protein
MLNTEEGHDLHRWIEVCPLYKVVARRIPRCRAHSVTLPTKRQM